VAEKAPRSHAPAAQRAAPQAAAAVRARAPAVTPTATAQALGNQAALHALGSRAGKSISRPDDPDEHQAEHLAGAFVSGSEPSGGRIAARRMSTGAGTGGGQALPGAARQDYERFFSTDLAAVRVHTDGAAARAATALGARAFTERDSIYFGRGQFDTGSQTGRHLLAHELAHVVQPSVIETATSSISRLAELAGRPGGATNTHRPAASRHPSGRQPHRSRRALARCMTASSNRAEKSGLMTVALAVRSSRPRSHSCPYPDGAW
jgi:Domain of unknown function (DUF4157)